MSSAAAAPRVLVYLLRRDLRLHDNPVFHELARLNAHATHRPYTHLLPVYVFAAQQVEVSGFLHADGPDCRSPYPEARSQVGRFWRCGHRRATFIAESVWDLKQRLEGVDSGLAIRVGSVGDVVAQLLDGLRERGAEVGGVWLTAEEGVEEKREEREVRRAVEQRGGERCEFKTWVDEKYFVDDRDLPFNSPKEMPDVFTSFKKMVEPLREAPRKELPTPAKSSLPPLPPDIPPQSAPFRMPSTFDELVTCLHKPLSESMGLDNPPQWPTDNVPKTAIPFAGGATAGQERIAHLLSSGVATDYKNTRNGMLGPDFSTKLSAWLAMGCITSREVHWRLLEFEDGETGPFSDSRQGKGFGKGENPGTAHLRFELLWRDFFRLCTRKYGPRLFRVDGFQARRENQRWSADREKLRRWCEGRTGTGLVDAAQRELFLTGYTSNRTRQNVASYLAKHLGLDWRLGAEWYEALLVDYDVSSNWGNWQYVAGVGQDPRGGGEGRRFNPVKQASDYDPDAAYCRAWVAEVRGVDSAAEAWQCWKVPAERRAALGLAGHEGAESPLVRIEYHGGGGKNKRGGGGYNGGPRRGKGKGARGGRGQDRMSQRGAV